MFFKKENKFDMVNKYFHKTSMLERRGEDPQLTVSALSFMSPIKNSENSPFK